MSKLLVPLIIVLALASGGFFLYKNLQKTPVYQPTPSSEITATSTPPIQNPTASPVTKSDPCEVLTKGSADIPPLYQEGIIWQQPAMTEYEVPLGEEGSKKMRGCLIKSQGVTDLNGRDVRIFYSGKMAESKWDPLTSADGMYSSIESYRKNSKYFVIQQNLAPGVSLPTQNPRVVIEVFYTQ